MSTSYKLNIRPIKGDKFEVEVNANMKVLDVKNVIKDLKGWDTSLQKLIFKGKILADDKGLEEYKIDSSGSLVIMVSKPKAAPKPAASTTPPPSTTTTTSTTTPAPTTPIPATPNTTTTTTTTAPAPNANVPPTSNLASSSPAPVVPGLNGEQYEAAVSQLTDMGFPRTECESALRAAFGDTARAVEYLMSGIPSGLDQQQLPPANIAPAQGTGVTSSNIPPAGAEATSTESSNANDPFTAFRQSPEFNDLKRIVQSNPGALGQVLQTLGQSNPALIQAINENREQFVQMMNEPIDESIPPISGGISNSGLASNSGGAIGGGEEEMSAVFQEMQSMPAEQRAPAILQAMQNMPPEQRAQLAQQMDVQPEQLEAITQMMLTMPPDAMRQMVEAMVSQGGGGASGQHTVNLTQEEAEAVERLTVLGFPRMACVEAYLACDKNEQLAANYLFNNPPMEEDEGPNASGNQ